MQYFKMEKMDWKNSQLKKMCIFAEHLKGVLLEIRIRKYKPRIKLVDCPSKFELQKAEIIPKEPGRVMLPRDTNRNPL